MRKVSLLGSAAEPEIGPPLSEQAYRLLREKILLGDIVPGSKLKTENLRRNYGFSNTPLREALNRLVAEGLVVADERRGFRATPVSVADFRDLTNYRLVLEHAALVDSMTCATDEWEAGVLAAYHRLEAAEDRMGPAWPKTSPEWTARHKAFHMALFAACESRRLFDQCSEMFDHAERYRRLSSFSRGKGPRPARGEHKRLTDLALARDIDATAALLRKHVVATAENCTKALAALSGQ
jgi:GntR family transcriptional regulator, carbon starvation induced regulator